MLQDPYPDIELAPPSLAQPLHEPSPIISRHSKFEDAASITHTRTVSSASRSSVGSKRHSYNMSGSTFLVTASGKTLRLPIPSESKSDPLNWGRWKRAGAIFALAWYFVASSLIVQAPSVVLLGIALEFGQQVSASTYPTSDHVKLIRSKDVRPWTMESIVTAPTLFIGIGSLLWLPLTLALGRRPVFLIVALIQPIATLGAGFSSNFHALLTCVCIVGLGQGFSITAVSGGQGLIRVT